MSFEVADVEAAVKELRDVFDDYDFPGLKTVDGIEIDRGETPLDNEPWIFRCYGE